MISEIDDFSSDDVGTVEEVSALLKEQVGRVVDESVKQRLRLEPEVAGKEIARFFAGCERLRKGKR